MTSMSDKGETGHRWFAATYELMTRANERRLGPWRQHLLEDLHGDVLEIGAGTGTNFEHYPADARVVALEPDPFMLRRAEAKRRPNIELRQAPAEDLPFADASFDVVVATLVLCTVRDLPRALSEIRRVLRPGGELRFIEHVRGGGLFGVIQDVAQPVWGWVSAGCQVNRRTEPAIVAAGFEVTAIDRRKMAPWMPSITGRARVPRGTSPVL
jgi:ubiquinone/menaquinone biosynthesis C-methylase UbiE